jgi:hypothetical protein
VGRATDGDAGVVVDKMACQQQWYYKVKPTEMTIIWPEAAWISGEFLIPR